MKKVYEDLAFTNVGLFESILNQHGIKTVVRNAGASGAMGEVPFTEVYPELWVVNDDDYEKARGIIEDYREGPPGEGTAWKCPKCGESIEKEFTDCWNCGEQKVED